MPVPETLAPPSGTRRSAGIDAPLTGITGVLGGERVQPTMPARPAGPNFAEAVTSFANSLTGIFGAITAGREREQARSEKEQRALEAAEWVDIVPDRVNLDYSKMERIGDEPISQTTERYLIANMPRYETLQYKNKMRLVDEVGSEFQRIVKRDAEIAYKEQSYESLHRAVQGITTPHLRDSVLSDSPELYKEYHKALGETAANRLFLDPLAFAVATGDMDTIEAIRPYAEDHGLGAEVARAANQAKSRKLDIEANAKKASEDQMENWLASQRLAIDGDKTAGIEKRSAVAMTMRQAVDDSAIDPAVKEQHKIKIDRWEFNRGVVDYPAIQDIRNRADRVDRTGFPDQTLIQDATNLYNMGGFGSGTLAESDYKQMIGFVEKTQKSAAWQATSGIRSVAAKTFSEESITPELAPQITYLYEAELQARIEQNPNITSTEAVNIANELASKFRKLSEEKNSEIIIRRRLKDLEAKEGLPRPQSLEDVEKLPQGTSFIWTDGSLKVRK